VRYQGMDLRAPGVNPVAVRTHIGLVFQKPKPFPKSIFDNVACGPRTVGFHGGIHVIVERALRRTALWDEAKNRPHARSRGRDAHRATTTLCGSCLTVFGHRDWSGRRCRCWCLEERPGEREW
jgi:ABC-type polar amino acid transport system ATPase subunit